MHGASWSKPHGGRSSPPRSVVDGRPSVQWSQHGNITAPPARSRPGQGTGRRSAVRPDASTTRTPGHPDSRRPRGGAPQQRSRRKPQRPSPAPPDWRSRGHPLTPLAGVLTALSSDAGSISSSSAMRTNSSDEMRVWPRSLMWTAVGDSPSSRARVRCDTLRLPISARMLPVMSIPDLLMGRVLRTPRTQLRRNATHVAKIGGMYQCATFTDCAHWGTFDT